MATAARGRLTEAGLPIFAAGRSSGQNCGAKGGRTRADKKGRSAAGWRFACGLRSASPHQAEEEQLRGRQVLRIVADCLQASSQRGKGTNTKQETGRILTLPTLRLGLPLLFHSRTCSGLATSLLVNLSGCDCPSSCPSSGNCSHQDS